MIVARSLSNLSNKSLALIIKYTYLVSLINCLEVLHSRVVLKSVTLHLSCVKVHLPAHLQISIPIWLPPAICSQKWKYFYTKLPHYQGSWILGWFKGILKSCIYSQLWWKSIVFEALWVLDLWFNIPPICRLLFRSIWFQFQQYTECNT